MITTGSKLLIGAAVAAAAFAVVYGVTQEGALGTIGLISAAVALALLAAINVVARDSNVWPDDPGAFEVSAAAQAAARPSVWPLLVALGATAVTVGLTTYEPIVIVGLIALIAGAIEWVVQAWSERASADPSYNADARERLIDPLEIPVAAGAGTAVIVYAFSRVMLGLPSKSATVVAFATVAALVLFVGAALSAKRNVSRTTLTGALSIVAIVLIAGGAAAGLNGEREAHQVHTPGDLAEENECGPEETEADENASQSVAAQSSIAAEIAYDGSRLTAKAMGADVDVLPLPRSAPSNVLFRNESGAPARLVVELHPSIDVDGNSVGPERACTALVEDGGVQLLTVEFTQPSWAVEGGLAFTVAGSDAALEVVVP